MQSVTTLKMLLFSFNFHDLNHGGVVLATGLVYIRFTILII
jgi:hypothetical protein